MNIKKQVQISTANALDNKRGIAHQLGLKGTKTPFHFRNLIIDNVLAAWLSTYPLSVFTSRVYHDVIEGQTRADHYGKPVGTVLSSYRKKRVDEQTFDDICAAKKAEIRSLCIELGTINKLKLAIVL